jgi:hypothetical protein
VRRRARWRARWLRSILVLSRGAGREATQDRRGRQQTVSMRCQLMSTWVFWMTSAGTQPWITLTETSRMSMAHVLRVLAARIRGQRQTRAWTRQIEACQQVRRRWTRPRRHHRALSRGVRAAATGRRGEFVIIPPRIPRNRSQICMSSRPSRLWTGRGSTSSETADSDGERKAEGD